MTKARSRVPESASRLRRPAKISLLIARPLSSSAITMRTRRQFGGELLGLFFHARIRRRRARRVDDDEIEFGKAELGRECTRALAIEIAQRLFGRLTRTAHRRDREPHRCALRGRADALGLRAIAGSSRRPTTCPRDRNRSALRRGRDARSRRPHRSEPNRLASGPRRARRDQPHSFSRRARFSASDATWRADRPVAMTIASHSDERPVRSIVTMSSALSSSREEMMRVEKRRVRWERMSCRYSALRVACGSGLGSFLEVGHEVRPCIRQRPEFVALPNLCRS